MSLTLNKMSDAQKAWTLVDYQALIKTTLNTYLTAKQESAWNTQVSTFITQIDSHETYAALHTALVALQTQCRSQLSSMSMGLLGSNQLYTTIHTLLNTQMPSVEDFKFLVAEHTFSPPVSPELPSADKPEPTPEKAVTPIPALCEEGTEPENEYQVTAIQAFVGFSAQALQGMFSTFTFPSVNPIPHTPPKTYLEMLNGGYGPGS